MSSSTAQSRLSAVASHLKGSGLLKDEVAIITGAAQGIGKATALKFAQEGAKVVVADLDQAKAELVAQEVKAAGGQAIAVGGNVMDLDFPKKLVDATVKAFGGINHLALIAGFTSDKMAHTLDDEGFELMLKVHCVAPFRLIREAAPFLRSKDPKVLGSNRSIVTVSSIAGVHGNVGQVNYSTAKSGILGLTKTLAKEWGPFGVRTNNVAPGYIETRLTANKAGGESIEIGGKKIALGIPQPKNVDEKAKFAAIPLGRSAAPEEVANTILFLASPMASFVTGVTLEVTGGQGI